MFVRVASRREPPESARGGSHHVALPASAVAPAEQVLGLQRAIGNSSCSRLLQRLHQSHTYDDPKIRQIHTANGAHLAAAQALLPPTIEHQLAPGETGKSIKDMPEVKTAVRNALQAANVGNVRNQTLAIEYMLAVGNHIIEVWLAGAKIFTFRVRVIPAGDENAGRAAAGAADLNYDAAINNATIDDVLSGPFIEAHTAPSSTAAEVAAYGMSRMRGKASTALVLDDPAKATLIAEWQARMRNGDYTTNRRFITNNQYRFYDYEPETHEVTKYDGPFEYGMFHNPVDGLWRISHFEQPTARNNRLVLSQNLAVAGSRVPPGRPVLTAPTSNQVVAMAGFQMQGTYKQGTTGVEVSLDNSGIWNPAALTPANNTWQYAVPAGYAAGPHDLFVKAKNRFDVWTHPGRTRVTAA